MFLQKGLDHPQLKLLLKALDSSQTGIIITDPSLKENPIIYLSKGFTEVTGYSEEEVIGKNCRFLQGEKTSQTDIDRIRKAVKQKESVAVTVLNYRKDGSPFYNQLNIDPIYIEEEQRFYFIGVQKDVTMEKHYQSLMEQAKLESDNRSTPIISIGNGVSVLPLIGSFPSERLTILMRNIMQHKDRTRDRYLIIDLSGLASLDQALANYLVNLNGWLKLLGTELMITGGYPRLAVSLESEELNAIKAFSGVEHALDYLKKTNQSHETFRQPTGFF
ncbi:PAS domain-containing protein [Bacillus mangrovi]|uniref:PAS domain-containing protein n=1 Tax=Metabacillus mangrovi TaxID=1491830 RepID=A0A7X2S3I2_9BACI|nr:STAS domain-containing protein [Metabacillus mangrovi]MTH53019.1 PAS domain-containing protein [Metabacillus mangrovi]